MWGRKQRQVELNEDSYARWLRAQRPPFEWFLGRPEEEQEAMAMLGDEYARDLVIAAGYAVHDPRSADDSLSAAAGDLAAEESLAKQVATALIRKMDLPEPPPKRSAPTMAGIGKSSTDNGASVRSLFGKEPDKG